VATSALRIGYYQFRPRFGAVRANAAKAVSALEKADADLLVLPELPFTGYNFRDRREVAALAEDPARSPTVDALAALCRRRRFHVVTGFAEKRRDRVFNSALLVGPRGLVHTYRKLHLFDREKRCFDPGDTPLTVQQVRGARIGMMICFDWIFPETARALALAGADVLCHPSNLVLPHCPQAMLTRCIENGVFAVTANRIGRETRPHGSLRFIGQSQVAAPGGKLLHRAPAAREELYVTAIDPGRARDKQVTPRNHLLRDRLPARYGNLVRGRRGGDGRCG
jgi:predicted amidohydrolase